MTVRSFLGTAWAGEYFEVQNFARPYVLGLAVGLVFRFSLLLATRWIKFKNPLAFIDTLEHELTHAVYGYLTLSPPLSLLATSEIGGEVQLKEHNILVALSPYFFPLWAFVALMIGLFIQTSLQPLWTGVTFFLLGSFFYRLLTEIRWYQPDLILYGRFFSLTIIAVLLFWILALFCHLSRWVPFSWTYGLGNDFIDAWQWLAHRFGKI